VTSVSRRNLLVGAAALVADGAAAEQSARTGRFVEHNLEADPDAFLVFLAAHNQSIVSLDLRMPWRSRTTGVRHDHFREGSFLVIIDQRRWWHRAAMLWTGIPRGSGEEPVIVHGAFQISTNRAFKGPSFSQVEGLPRWAFTGYHVDPFA
jgi:hypothetical protein